MKKCPHCAEDIKAEAVKCRYCGSQLDDAPMRRAVEVPQAPRVVQVRVQPTSGLIMRTVKGAIALMTFVILASVIGTCAFCGKVAHDVAKHEASDRAAVRSASAASIVDVSSDTLQADYAANEVNADNQYRGRVLRVTGAVQSIRKGITDRPYVVLWTRNQFSGVHANFQNENGVGGIAVNQHITVRCIGDNEIMGSPMLKDCVLE